MALSASAVTIYYDNSGTKWSKVGIHYWSNPSTTWPGEKMTQVDDNVWSFTFASDPSGLNGFIFNNGDGSDQTGDYTHAPIDGHIYKGAGGKGAVTDMGVYAGAGDVKPVVVASPESGTRFDSSVTVTLTVNPASAIYYTLDGTTPTANSTRYTQPITLTETTTLTTYAVSEAGKENVQTFEYKKRNVNAGPTNTKKVENSYYKVNPDGKCGTNRTVDMKFNKINNDNRMCVAENALSHWSDADLICQGVARDIASAIKGKHEYPVIDSYAIYASYDAENLYLGIQYVYNVWDQWGDGRADNGRAKPYQMDGRMCIAFDLDPELEFEGILGNGNTIWDADGQYSVFNNGTDCILLCSTKPSTGVPGLFFPNPQGKASYDAPYCKGFNGLFYGLEDGLLPSIKNIWGVKKYEYNPADLTEDDMFTDLKSESKDDLHTFYEFKLPLNLLGISESFIKNTGIGVMVIDTYGQGAIGSTPYDPCTLDNASKAYSKDASSSMEKEDKDVFTYAHARIGKVGASTSGVQCVAEVEENAPVSYYSLQGVRLDQPIPGTICIKRQGNKATKVLVK